MATKTIRTGSAEVQGPLWSTRAEDWVVHQEHVVLPLYESVLAGLEIGEGLDLLDAGCGSGLFALLAERAGARVHGLDAAAGPIAIARRRLPRAEFRIGELEDFPYDDGAFDIVTGFNSFQYATDPVRALREASRVTRSGGRVVAGGLESRRGVRGRPTSRHSARSCRLRPPGRGARSLFRPREPSKRSSRRPA
jgi:SAM-dependent methyltransferase